MSSQFKEIKCTPKMAREAEEVEIGWVPRIEPLNR